MRRRAKRSYLSACVDDVHDEHLFEIISGAPPYAGLRGLAEVHPERAWPLILDLVGNLPADLLRFSATMLEPFVARYGHDFIDRIEVACRTNAAFRHAAGEMLIPEDQLPKQIKNRLINATRGHIRFLALDIFGP
jgi:hypothetical protein